MRLHFDNLEGPDLPRLKFAIAGFPHFINCVSISEQWPFVIKHPLIWYELWFEVDFGIVVPFVRHAPIIIW